MFTGQSIVTCYFIIAVAATLFFALRLVVFNFFDFGDFGDDTSHAMESDEVFSFLSLQSILAFLMGFGWIGLAAMREYHLDTLSSLALAFAAGALFTFLSALLMRQVKKLNKTTNINLSKCVDELGKAYTKFAPGGAGQIQITINGRLATTNAINIGDEEIEAFAPIKVAKVENNVIYVQKLTQQ
jgi:membrane protein implicated in regulation of membrane protease activity